MFLFCGDLFLRQAVDGTGGAMVPVTNISSYINICTTGSLIITDLTILFGYGMDRIAHGIQEMSTWILFPGMYILVSIYILQIRRHFWKLRSAPRKIKWLFFLRMDAFLTQSSHLEMDQPGDFSVQEKVSMSLRKEQLTNIADDLQKKVC